MEDSSIQETATVVKETMKEYLKPGQTIKLSMLDIKKAIKKGSSELSLYPCNADYGPLPTYYFTLNQTRLKRILDTGAAMNYIARNKFVELISLKNKALVPKESS